MIAAHFTETDRKLDHKPSPTKINPKKLNPTELCPTTLSATKVSPTELNARISQRAKAFIITAILASQLAIFAPPSQAQSVGPSELSALSALPFAMVLAAPSVLLGTGVVLTVVAVDASARGTVWVLERASDGARMSVELVGASVVGLGTAVVVTALSTGWILSNAARALAFIPNEIGASLLYNERITR
jgi:hypothetical protein